MGYYDLEAYEDEWRTAVPLYITMFACRVFEIDMLQFVPDKTGVGVGPNALARDVIKERREAMGLSARKSLRIAADLTWSLHPSSKPAG
jgi:hypothetical protein